jgi:ferredoxin
MLHDLAEQGTRRTVWWLQAAQDGENHPFAGEARELLSRLPAGRELIAYSRPRDVDRLGADYTISGRLGLEQIRALDPPQDADAYICGPDGFMRDMTAALEACGLPPSRIHTEIFGATAAINPGVVGDSARAPHQPAHAPGDVSGPSVAFVRSGLTLTWHEDYGTLLELAEACDVPVRWSCRTGVCHTCETALLAGRVEYSPEPVEAPAEGSVLICCSTPSDDLVLDI